MPSLFLSREELEQLTGYKKPSAQARALNAMGIEYRERPDGAVIVLRSHLEAILGGGADPQPAPPEPDWSGLDDAAA